MVIRQKILLFFKFNLKLLLRLCVILLMGLQYLRIVTVYLFFMKLFLNIYIKICCRVNYCIDLMGRYLFQELLEHFLAKIISFFVGSKEGNSFDLKLSEYLPRGLPYVFYLERATMLIARNEMNFLYWRWLFTYGSSITIVDYIIKKFRLFCLEYVIIDKYKPKVYKEGYLAIYEYYKNEYFFLIRNSITIIFSYFFYSIFVTYKVQYILFLHSILPDTKYVKYVECIPYLFVYWTSLIMVLLGYLYLFVSRKTRDLDIFPEESGEANFATLHEEDDVFSSFNDDLDSLKEEEVEDEVEDDLELIIEIVPDESDDDDLYLLYEWEEMFGYFYNVFYLVMCVDAIQGFFLGHNVWFVTGRYLLGYAFLDPWYGRIWWEFGFEEWTPWPFAGGTQQQIDKVVSTWLVNWSQHTPEALLYYDTVCHIRVWGRVGW
jgi:hypothetical protein